MSGRHGLLMALGLLADSGAATPVSTVSDSDRAWTGCRTEQSDFCDGYVLGTFDRMSMHGEICPSVSVTASQARALVRRYVREFPAARAYSFPYATAEALRKTYPCEVEKWSRYQDPVSMRGLQTKPIDVRYGDRGIYINGEVLDASSAVKLLSRSRDLSPVPDILVSIEEDSYESAVPFLRAISDEGLCDGAKCRYRLVKQ